MPVIPRARGALTVAAKQRDGRSVIADLRQAGSMKALFPRAADASLSCVFLNTAGGMTGGDDFQLVGRAGAGSHLSLTSQAAERIYGATGDEPARFQTQLDVAAGARLDWLPQETILFHGCAIERKLQVDLAADATFLMVEPLVFGRTTMGETIRAGTFCDDIRISRDGTLIFADAVRLSGDIEHVLQGAAVANENIAMASVVYAASDAEAHLGALRDLMPETGGVSLIRQGVLFARLLAPDSFLLRRALMPIMAQLSRGALPKTWML